MDKKPEFQRVLIKLSGEALMGNQGFGITPEMIHYVAQEVAKVYQLGVEISIVVVGGNIFRGVAGSSAGMDRTSADNMGMLAT
ncbi:MAG: UMP kinase, partial [Desulfobacterales bacterium]|nr:UMP kinase [Desulfobacterales bacterium]